MVCIFECFCDQNIIESIMKGVFVTYLRLWNFSVVKKFSENPVPNFGNGSQFWERHSPTPVLERQLLVCLSGPGTFWLFWPVFQGFFDYFGLLAFLTSLAQIFWRILNPSSRNDSTL